MVNYGKSHKYGSYLGISILWYFKHDLPNKNGDITEYKYNEQYDVGFASKLRTPKNCHLIGNIMMTIGIVGAHFWDMPIWMIVHTNLLDLQQSWKVKHHAVGETTSCILGGPPKKHI